MIQNNQSIRLVGWEFNNNNSNEVRSSVYLKTNGSTDKKKVNRYNKISNAGKVLGVIPVVGAVVGAARIITTVTDDKRLYGDSYLKKAGFIARGATEIIGLGIVWGMADAVSSLFRALSGKKTNDINQINSNDNQADVTETKNNELSQRQQEKKNLIIGKFKSLMGENSSFLLYGEEKQVTPKNLREQIPSILGSIQEDNPGVFTTDEIFALKVVLDDFFEEFMPCYQDNVDSQATQKALNLFDREIKKILER